MKTLSIVWGTLGVMLVSSVPALSQDITLDVGDTLALTIAGLGQLNREMTISGAGTISVPLLGEIGAVGRSVGDVEAEIKKLIPDTVFRQRDGNEETLIIVRPEEVSLEVARYRPVVVDGAVMNPGEVAFSHGLTVRHAVALAGGLSVGPIASTDLSPNDYIKLQVEYETRLAEYANVVAALAFSRALLNGDESVDLSDLGGLPVEGNVVDRLTQTVSNRLDSALYERETAHAELREALDRGEDQFYSALRLLESSQARLIAEEEELERVETFFERNLYTAERLVTARRAYHEALSNLLDAQERVTEVEVAYGTTQRRLKGVERGLDAELQAEISELTMRAQLLEAEISELGDQLAHVATEEAVETGRGGLIAHYTLIRRDQGEWVEQDATLTDALKPGDIVSVAVPVDASR